MRRVEGEGGQISREGSIDPGGGKLAAFSVDLKVFLGVSFLVNGIGISG